MVIKDSPVVTVIMGLFFAFVGIFMLAFPNFFNEVPPWWLSAVFILIGLSVALFSKFSTIAINKNGGKISFFRKNLMGREFEDFDISQVKEIKLKRRVEISSVNANSRTFCVYIIMNAGQAVALPGCGSSFHRRKETIARKLADFIGVPFAKDFGFSATSIFDAIKNFTNKK